jgi:predicted DNA-binding WGR domain protein
MPRYELGNKFWTIEIDGASLKTSAGKVGTDGVAKVKAYATPQEANREYDRLVAEKVVEGYALIGDATNVTVPGSPKAKRAKAPTARQKKK